MHRIAHTPKPTKTPYPPVCHFTSNKPYSDTLVFLVDMINRFKESEYNIRRTEIAIPLHAHRLSSQMASISILSGGYASTPILPPAGIIEAHTKIEIIKKKIGVLETALRTCTESNFQTIKASVLEEIAAIDNPPSMVASAIPSSSYKPYSR